jgi:hypothetical protein
MEKTKLFQVKSVIAWKKEIKSKEFLSDLSSVQGQLEVITVYLSQF